MTRKKAMQAELQQDGPGSSEPLKPLSGITYENYVEKGIAFTFAAQKVFTIVRNEHSISVPYGFKPTPRQWGAWMEYFQALYENDPRPNHVKNWPVNRIAVLMRSRGWGTVPAEWPHLFDADWYADRDSAASNRAWDKHQAWLEKHHNKAAPAEVSMALRTPAAPPSEELKQMLQESEGL